MRFFRMFAPALALFSVAAPASAQEYLNGIKWNKPEIIKPGETDSQPPSDAIILFGGKDLSAWVNGDRWTLEEGNMIAGKGVVTSKQKFGDCQVHIEWSAPKDPVRVAETAVSS
jgi:hypothetical protein